MHFDPVVPKFTEYVRSNLNYSMFLFLKGLSVIEVLQGMMACCVKAFKGLFPTP